MDTEGLLVTLMKRTAGPCSCMYLHVLFLFLASFTVCFLVLTLSLNFPLQVKQVSYVLGIFKRTALLLLHGMGGGGSIFITHPYQTNVPDFSMALSLFKVPTSPALGIL